MTDITAPLAELRSAYRAYQNAKRDKKEEIQEKYRMQMEDEIRQAIQAEKFAFAKRLKDTKEFYDLRVTDIQDHVLRTRNWKVWEELRDFAGMQPEQVTRENAREAKKRENATFLWSDDYATLIVKRNSRGDVLHPEVTYNLATKWKSRSGRWEAEATDESYEHLVRTQDAEYAFGKMVSAEIQRQVEAGNVPEGELK